MFWDKADKSLPSLAIKGNPDLRRGSDMVPMGTEGRPRWISGPVPQNSSLALDYSKCDFFFLPRAASHVIEGMPTAKLQHLLMKLSKRKVAKNVSIAEYTCITDSDLGLYFPTHPSFICCFWSSKAVVGHLDRVAQICFLYTSLSCLFLAAAAEGGFCCLLSGPLSL